MFTKEVLDHASFVFIRKHYVKLTIYIKLKLKMKERYKCFHLPHFNLNYSVQFLYESNMILS